MKTFRHLSFCITPHTLFSFLISLYPLLLSSPSVVIAQWEPDQRLTLNAGSPQLSFNNSRCIAVNGNMIYIVWSDRRDGNPEIYLKRSNNQGLSWSQDTRLTNDPDTSLSPAVSVAGDYVYVVWQDHRDNKWEIYYKYSTDLGLTWSHDVRFTKDGAFSTFPSVLAIGSYVHVVWGDKLNRDKRGSECPGIFYKLSTDKGISWSEAIRLTKDCDPSCFPSIAISNSKVYIIWEAFLDWRSEINYICSDDNGSTWSQTFRLTDDRTRSAMNPSVSCSGTDVYAVWYDNCDDNWEIYYTLSKDQGKVWSKVIRLTNNIHRSKDPSIESSNSNVYVIWRDNREDGYTKWWNWHIYYKRSTDRGKTWSRDIRLTDVASSLGSPSFALSDTMLHIVWVDTRNGKPEIYYKRINTNILLK